MKLWFQTFQMKISNRFNDRLKLSNFCPHQFLSNQQGENRFVLVKLTDVDVNSHNDVKLDVWQANYLGLYDTQQKEGQPSFNLRGDFRIMSEERRFLADIQKFDPNSDDVPVVALTIQLKRHPYQSTHSHKIISKEGFEELTTKFLVRRFHLLIPKQYLVYRRVKLCFFEDWRYC